MSPPLSKVRRGAGQVFLSGELPLLPDGSLPQGIEAQTEQALKNIETVLDASGSSMAHVVKTTVFLADMNDFAKMNEVYAKRMGEPFPARSTVQVARLPRDAKIEIEAEKKKKK